MSSDTLARLSMRREGAAWVAYITRPDTFDGAIYIGMVMLSAIAHDPERRRSFLSTMRDRARSHVEAVTGQRVEFRGGRTVA